jgi:hypothetical protein
MEIKIFVKVVLNINDRVARTEFIWLRIGTSAGCCEYGNEPLGSIKCREFLNQPRIWQVLKAHSTEYLFLLVWNYSSYSKTILTNSL